MNRKGIFSSSSWRSCCKSTGFIWLSRSFVCRVICAVDSTSVFSIIVFRVFMFCYMTIGYYDAALTTMTIVIMLRDIILILQSIDLFSCTFNLLLGFTIVNVIDKAFIVSRLISDNAVVELSI